MTDGVKRASRESVFLSGQLASEGEDLGSARIANLSATGALIHVAAGLVPAARVTLTLRNIGEVEGTVVRVHGNKVAIKFDTNIDPSLARRPVAAQPNALPDFLRPIAPVRKARRS